MNTTSLVSPIQKQPEVCFRLNEPYPTLTNGVPNTTQPRHHQLNNSLRVVHTITNKRSTVPLMVNNERGPSVPTKSPINMDPTSYDPATAAEPLDPDQSRQVTNVTLDNIQFLVELENKKPRWYVEYKAGLPVASQSYIDSMVAQEMAHTQAEWPKLKQAPAYREFQDDPELWDYIGMSKSQFLALSPTEQFDLEYRSKVNIRELILRKSNSQCDSTELKSQASQLHVAEKLFLTTLRDFTSEGTDKLIELFLVQASHKMSKQGLYPDMGQLYGYYKELINSVINNQKARPQDPTDDPWHCASLYNELSQLAQGQLNEANEEITWSAIATHNLEVLSEAVEFARQRDLQEATNLALNEFQKRIRLAKQILAPVNPKENDIWHVAMTTAVSAARGLYKHPDQAHTNYMTNSLIRRASLNVIAGLLLSAVRENQAPDWALTKRLIHNAHLTFIEENSQPPNGESFATLIAKALVECRAGPLDGSCPVAEEVIDMTDPIEIICAMLKKVDLSVVQKRTYEDAQINEAISLLEKVEIAVSTLTEIIEDHGREMRSFFTSRHEHVTPPSRLCPETVAEIQSLCGSLISKNKAILITKK